MVFIIVIITATAARNFGPGSLLCFTRANARQIFRKIETENTLFSLVHESVGQRELRGGAETKTLSWFTSQQLQCSMVIHT